MLATIARRLVLLRRLALVVMDAPRASDALKARPVKTDRSDARALAAMLRTGWFAAVFVKSEESHRSKALLSARDQLVRNKRTSPGSKAERPGCWRSPRADAEENHDSHAANHKGGFTLTQQPHVENQLAMMGIHLMG